MSVAAFDNRVTRALGIRYPIVQGGMQWVGTMSTPLRSADSAWRTEVHLHDGDARFLTAGQCIGLIDDVPTCAELIERMVRDCRAQEERASQMWS